jgi:uridine kinase
MSPTTDRPFLIGIAGGSGSGKTFLAKAVADAVGPELVAVLSMDQYFAPVASDWVRADINFDHPAHLDFRLMLSHLRDLRDGKTVRAPTYDFATMERCPEFVAIEPKPVILVEGLFVLAKPMVELLDVTCFLDVQPDQRLLGRILRDVRERASDLQEIVDRYQRFVRPSYEVFVAPTKQNADIVVDFSFRRVLFEKLLTMLVRSYGRQELDVPAFVESMRSESDHLAFVRRGGSMPVSIDIFQLAQAYPESVAAKPSLRF